MFYRKIPALIKQLIKQLIDYLWPWIPCQACDLGQPTTDVVLTVTKKYIIVQYNHKTLLLSFMKRKQTITRTLTKSERAPPRVCHYNSYFFGDDLKLWPPDLKVQRYISLSILHLCLKYESCTLKTTQVIVSAKSVDKVLLWPWPLDLKMYKYISLTILHLCMKYESCTLKTT